MMKTGMVRPGVYKIGHPHLGNAPQALKIRMLYKVVNERICDRDKTVYGIVLYFQLVDGTHRE